MSNRFAQEEKPNLATITTVNSLVGNVDAGLTQGGEALSRAILHFTGLKSNVEYSAGTVATTLKLFLDRLNMFQDIINREQGTQEKLQQLPELEDLPTPSVDNEPASRMFRAGTDQLTIFRRLLLRVYPQINQVITILKEPIDKKEEWAIAFIPTQRKYQNLVVLTKTLGFNKAAGVVVVAYPLSFQWKASEEPADLKKWKAVATQMAAFKRAYPDYTFPQILYHFTSEWDMFERFKFKNWYKWTQKTAEAKRPMEKKALQDYVMQDQAQKFQKKKKLLLSRIDLVRKGLRDLINSSLIDSSKSNKIYKILAMLEYETLGMMAPKMASARIRRAGKQIQKLGFTEGSEVLYVAANEITAPSSIVKTAQEIAEEEEKVDSSKVEQTTNVLRRIKTQMDKLSYTRHLDELFYIKKELEKMGRDGDAESILKIIKDDLDALDKLNKKLTDVYTNLSRLPVELSQKEDEKISTPQSKAQPVALEVEESDEDPEVEIEEVPAAKPVARAPQPRPAREPSALTPKPAAPAAPQVRREIPNV